MPQGPMARGETGTAPETQPGAAAKPPILFVNLSRGWGGGEVWHRTMAQALAGRGWPVTLLVHPDGALAQRAEAAGLPTRRMALRTASLLNAPGGGVSASRFRRLTSIWRSGAGRT